MNLFNKLPTLVNRSLHKRTTVSSVLLKQFSLSPKYGAVLYEKPTVNADVGRRIISTSVKYLNETAENTNKLGGLKEFIIEDFKEEDVSEAIDLVAKNYSSRDPLRRMLHVSYEDEMKLLNETVHKMVGNKVSVIARDRNTNKIVGTCIPKIHSSCDETAIDVSSLTNYNMNIKNCLLILQMIRTSANLFEKYNVDKIMEPSRTAIDPASSGKGVLRAICEEVWKRAKENDFRVLIGVPTHPVTQVYCKNMGGILESELDFDSIKIDGKQVLDLERKIDFSSFKLYSFHR